MAPVGPGLPGLDGVAVGAECLQVCRIGERSAVGDFDDVVCFEVFCCSAVAALWFVGDLLVVDLLPLVSGEGAGVAAGIGPGFPLVRLASALVGGACSAVAAGGGCVWHGVGPCPGEGVALLVGPGPAGGAGVGC